MISALIYADDLILMAEKEQDLQKLLNSVQLTKAFCSLLLKQLLAELFVFATLNNSTLFSSRLLDDTYRVMTPCCPKMTTLHVEQEYSSPHIITRLTIMHYFGTEIGVQSISACTTLP